MATMLEVGSYKTPCHYAVIGEPTDFYIWVREHSRYGSNSKWFIGIEAFELYNRFRQLKKKEFVELVRAIHTLHKAD